MTVPLGQEPYCYFQMLSGSVVWSLIAHRFFSIISLKSWQSEEPLSRHQHGAGIVGDHRGGLPVLACLLNLVAFHGVYF